MDELKFLVVAEASGYCDAETGLCIDPGPSTADDVTPQASETAEQPEEPAARP